MNECYNIVVVVKVATAVRGGESRTANSDRALVLGGGGLEKLDLGRDCGETFFLTAVAISIATRPFKFREISVSNSTSSFVSSIQSLA